MAVKNTYINKQRLTATKEENCIQLWLRCFWRRCHHHA